MAPKRNKKKPMPNTEEPAELMTEDSGPLYARYLEHARLQNAARSWMWVGVASVAAMIIILWGWAMKSKMDTLNWKKAPEKQLFEKTRAEWDKVFADNKENTDQLGETKEKMKGMLQQILTATSTGTTTVSVSGTAQ